MRSEANSVDGGGREFANNELARTTKEAILALMVGLQVENGHQHEK